MKTRQFFGNLPGNSCDSPDMSAYIKYFPGKRKAPKPPPPMPPMPPKPLPVGESNYERLGKVAKVNKVQKIEEEGQVEQPVTNLPEIPMHVPQNNNMSPRLWFRKNKNKDSSSTTMPSPQNGLQKSKSSTRPISLLASISDFDREAAKIVQQRQRDEEKRRYINDESFYVKTEPQEAIDEIMANVEQKMECLDAIGKHNNRWEEKLETQQQRESFDMNGLVSDLNQFLNTTRREMMTPKTARKLGQQHHEGNETAAATVTNDGKATQEMSTKQAKAISKATTNKVDTDTDHEAKMTKIQPEKSKKKIEAKTLPVNTDKSKGAISKVKNDPRRPKTKKNNEYEETWNCTKCTLINSVKNKVCILCGASFLNSTTIQAPETQAASPLNLEKSESSADLILDARDENDEEMPKRGNVLDRVVQFTALQMIQDEVRPTSAMNSRTETPRNSANLESLEQQRPLSAMNANEMIFTPTPIVHRQQNKPTQNYEQKRISMLEKEETTEILARWKKEHEEREKARREFFRNFQHNEVPVAAPISKPQDSVLESQKALLEQASRNLDRKTKAMEEQQKKVKEKIQVENVTKQLNSTPAKMQRQALPKPKGPAEKVSSSKQEQQQKLIRREENSKADKENIPSKEQFNKHEVDSQVRQETSNVISDTPKVSEEPPPKIVP